MKKITSVAGTALATPLSRNTAIKARKAGTRHGSAQLRCARARGSRWRPSGGGTARTGALRKGAALSAHRPSASSATPLATITGMPASAGSTLAVSTPASDRPSRQLTIRDCVTAPPPSRAPQAWCSTPSAL